MAEWNGGILTNKGRALAAKVEAGTCKLTLTKMKVGDGEPSTIETLTDLASPQQVIAISSIPPSDDGSCDVGGVITNAELEKGFYIKELGLFATDPDDGEILYAVATASKADYLQAKGGAAVESIDCHMKIAISSASVVNLTTTLTGLVTAEDLEKHNTSDSAHENRFKLFEKIADFGDDLIKKLALTTAITAITALETGSWFGQLLKMVLTASGVKYNIATNGYICFGSFFGGLIIQWISPSMSSDSYYGDFSLPIAFSNKIFGCYAMDIIGGSSSAKMTEASFSWVQGDSTLSKIRFVTDNSSIGGFEAIAIGY